MAKLVGHVNVRIDQAGADEQENRGAVTSFGLPGSLGARASMASVHLNVHAAVYDDMSVWIGLNGQISDAVLVGDGVYASAYVVSPKDWNFVKSGNTVGGWPGNAAVFRKDVPTTDGSAAIAPSWAAGETAWQASQWFQGVGDYAWFLWNFSCGNPPEGSYPGDYTRCGNLTDYGGNDSNQDGYAWIGGTGTYEMDDPVYPDPVRITIPGWLAFLDYYPFAIRKSGTMQSCNRTGGSVKIRKGSWQDVKNIAKGEGDNKAFVRKSGKWEVAPKIGANAK